MVWWLAHNELDRELWWPNQHGTYTLLHDPIYCVLLPKFLKRIQVFSDVCSIARLEVSDVSIGTLWPWRWRRYGPWETMRPTNPVTHTNRHILSSTTLKTSNLNIQNFSSENAWCWGIWCWSEEPNLSQFQNLTSFNWPLKWHHSVVC